MSKKAQKAAMEHIQMRGDPVAYRQRIADFSRGFIAASEAPDKFIVICKDMLAEAITVNTDASLADARHIINTVLKTTDDEIYRAVMTAAPAGGKGEK